MKPLATFIALSTSFLVVALSFSGNVVAQQREPQPVEKQREIRRLPGCLDDTPVFNSNCPEVVLNSGILLSTFPKKDGVEENENPHLDREFQGRFDIFAHHIHDGKKSTHMEDLYLGFLVGNLGDKPATVEVLSAASYLSRPDAPFLPLPPLVKNDDGNIYAGPGDRVTTELIRGMQKDRSWPHRLTIPPGKTVLLKSLPVPVLSLDMPLNGRNVMVKLKSDKPVRLALVSRFAYPQANGEFRTPSESEFLSTFDEGRLVKPRENAPTEPDEKGPLRYGRVAGVTLGSTWNATLVDPGLDYFAPPDADKPVSYPISSLRQGAFGTGQIESAPLLVRYPDTAYQGHGNYGVRYNLTLPLKNDTKETKTVNFALETPIKSDKSTDKVTFFEPPHPQVHYRGTIKTAIGNRTSKDHYMHLVERRGESVEPFLSVELAPGAKRTVFVEFYYPADCTPPQLLTVSSSSGVQSSK